MIWRENNRGEALVYYLFFPFQIATLKAALARKEGQGVQLQHSHSLSPERFRVKSAGSSPLHSSQKSTGDWSGGRRQQLEDFGNVEVLSKY